MINPIRKRSDNAQLLAGDIFEYRVDEFLKAKSRPAYIRKYKNVRMLIKMMFCALEQVEHSYDAHDIDLIINRIGYLNPKLDLTEARDQQKKRYAMLLMEEQQQQIDEYWKVWEINRENLLAENLIDRPIRNGDCLIGYRGNSDDWQITIESASDKNYISARNQYGEFMFTLDTRLTIENAVKMIQTIREFHLHKI